MSWTVYSSFFNFRPLTAQRVDINWEYFSFTFFVLFSFFRGKSCNPTICPCLIVTSNIENNGFINWLAKYVNYIKLDMKMFKNVFWIYALGFAIWRKLLLCVLVVFVVVGYLWILNTLFKTCSHYALTVTKIYKTRCSLMTSTKRKFKFYNGRSIFLRMDLPL